ncbi:MAG: serine hydrolase domain-containing protein [Myxococcota bacterium]
MLWRATRLHLAAPPGGVGGRVRGSPGDAGLAAHAVRSGAEPRGRRVAANGRLRCAVRKPLGRGLPFQRLHPRGPRWPSAVPPRIRTRGFLAAEIIGPAGLGHTTFAPSGHCQDERSGFALGDAERLQLDAQNAHMSNGFSAGGIRSTASDLAAWGTALLDGRVLQPSSTVALFTEERDHYAYGWEIGTYEGRRYDWHGGKICGFANQVVLFPDDKLVVVAWANNRDFAIDSLVRGLVSLARGQEPPPVDEPELVKLSEAERGGIVGRYRITTDGRAAALRAGAPEAWLDAVKDLVVVDRGAQLYIENLGGLLSATRDGLVVRSWRIAFGLERDETMRVTTMHLRQDGASIEYDRTGS